MVLVARSSDAPAGSIDVVRLGYDALGARYHEWSRDTSLRVRFIQQLLDRLSKDSRVLDLGCGPGDPRARLLSERFAVVGVDLSQVQIGLARKAAPTAAFVVGDMTHMGLRREAFDAVVSFYAFGHLPSALHGRVLTDIAGWLRPGALLVANAPVGTDDGVHDWLGVQMFFGGIGANAMLAAIEDVGLCIESAEQIIEDEGDGQTATFLWVIARKERA
jgi:SAM-dependent methyltransferase